MENSTTTAHQRRLFLLGSHQTEEAKQVVRSVFDEHGLKAGWQFLGENWDWFDATFHLADIVAYSEQQGRISPVARKYFMSDAEHAQFRKLPIQVVVYRGGCGADIENGLSWTLNRSVAEWFAAHSVGPRRAGFGFSRGEPRIVSGSVPRSRLLGIKIGRQESEVIALPGSVFISR
jgi:hypothetical protein